MPDYYAMNATQASIGSVANTMSLSGLLYIGILLVVIGVLILAASSLEHYKKLWDSLSIIIGTLKYTATGLAVAVIGYALYLICEFVTSVGSAIDPIYYAYAIGGYIALTVVGYATWKIGIKLKAYHIQMKENKTL
jgi:glucan phosphoethanolaminetransferase (alkaline phosphatase superfamily)